MNSEKKPEGDEDEKPPSNAPDPSWVLCPSADHVPPPRGPAEPCLQETCSGSGHGDQPSTSKRGFAELSRLDTAVLEEDSSRYASKRMRLEEAESLTCAEPGVQTAPAPGTSREDSTQDHLTAASGVSAAQDTLEMDPERQSALQGPVLAPEGDVPFPLQEVSVSCTGVSLDPAPRCDTCGHLLASSSDLDKRAECPPQLSVEHAWCHCGHRAESLDLQLQATRTHMPSTFSCDLCGFQCAKEGLLSAHRRSKMHLRRQDLAARRGFVQVLSKPALPRRPSALGARTARPRPRASRDRDSDIRAQRAAGAGEEDSSHSAIGQGASEPLREMWPSNMTSSQQPAVPKESVTSLGQAQNPESPSKTPSTSIPSESLCHTSETGGSAVQTAHSLTRPRAERLILLGNGFRRRGGTLALKGQAKKRFSLLGMNKRGTSETQRLYVKHFRRPTRVSDVQVAAKQAGPASSVLSVRVATVDAQELRQDASTAHLNAEQPLPDPSALWTCADCGHTAASRPEWDSPVDRCQARAGRMRCPTCASSAASSQDGSERQRPASPLICHCCSFVTETESVLHGHMKEKHGLGFRCAPCDRFFVTLKDLDTHRTTEKHLSLSGQLQTAPSLDSGLELQTGAPASAEQESKGGPGSQVRGAAQDEARSRVSSGSEVRHLALGKPQFQCKKCFYKTRSSTVLTRHIKLRHGQDYHFLCKACNLYSLSKEGMEKHIKRSKHLENAKKNNIGLSFEECIERVCIGANDKKEEVSMPGSGRTEGQGEGTESQEKEVLISREPAQSGTTKDNGVTLTSTPKRGRPKGSVSRTCSHCGLLASSITNLTVHIRRKHSHQYSYLCKVCKYYTVTKGDMERHCATKKHKGRVQVEASGQRSSDIVVCPEGGSLEACRKTTNLTGTGPDEHAAKSAAPGVPLPAKVGVDHGDPVQGQGENVSPPVDGEVNSHLAEKREEVPLEPKDLVQDGEARSQREVTGTSDNKCAHCEFHTHSAASLELHVKRKHTKEFEFYCMACDYYAVTRKEMTRHAATEKHKIKRQSYLNSADAETMSSELSRSIVITEEGQQQSSEEFQIVLEPSSESFKSRNATDGSSSDAHTHVGVVKVLCGPESVEIETEADSNLSKEQPVCPILRLPLVKNKVVQPEDLVSLNLSSSPSSLSGLQNVHPGSPLSTQEVARENRVPRAHGESQSRGAGSGEHTMMDVPREFLAQVGSEQRALGAVPSPGGTPVLQTAVHLEAGVVEGGLTADSAVESNDVYETIISIDDRGQALDTFGRFDSSIIRIKSPQEGDLMGRPEEGLAAPGMRLSELPPKEPTNGMRKKRPDGGCFGDSTRIRCDDCGFLADGLSGLNVHIAMKHPTKEKHFHCLLCGKSFYTESNLHQHLASAGHLRNEQASVEELPEGGATFKCVKCTEPFDSEQSLFLHIKGQHEELLREVNKYIVEDTEQINREREENQGSVCKYCGKMCRSSNSMAFLAHIRTHTGSKPFKCKICHFATAQLGDARNHVKRHLGMREYKCHICGVAFVMKKHLNTHLLGKHGVGTPKERKFTCHLCDRSFTEKWALNNHMKLHTGEKPFKCTWPTCHYSFLTASAMKDHYRTHTGEKSFLCDLCGFAGGTRHALTKHRRQHTGEKPFKCEECNFASTTQSHLTRHKRVHTGEKPYSCPWCDYRSNCAENIRKHILHTGKHEGVKMYNCPKCDYGTNVPVEFRNHLKEQHPDIENPDLAYLHAGIVSKSYECRLKGQGAAFVETDSPFTAAALAEEAPVRDKPPRSKRPVAPAQQVQQVIIIQDYDGEFAVDASVEETAAATLQTLAMAGQVARVLHISEDGQVIATSQSGAHLPEQLTEGATQVVVVGGPVDSGEVDGRLLQQVSKQELVSLSEAGLTPPDSSALDALLCAVSELGEVEGRAGREDKGRYGHRDVLVQMSGQDALPAPAGPGTPELPLFPDAQSGPGELGPVEVVTQVVRPSALLASQERAQVAFKKVVQGVLQFAVCDPSAADQLLHEGVTQVIVNEEGAVHMVAREGAPLIMQGVAPRGLRAPTEHLDLVESDGEVSQIIVTEELIQAMVQESATGFAEGATHYIVTELPPGVQDEAGVYSHTVIEAAGSPEVLQAGAALSTDGVAPEGQEQMTSMVIYTQSASPAAAVVPSPRESSGLQDA
ncbi:PREDICTED: zinc finger protein 407 [Elephantulus edwardii]|uniref:zinc finger protein 407 n=1 Tax=Elephantulus edwardii TaxID=28737 RepID=UPI0003F0AAB6|nr:PREDICTED: zinc finger protein 407 [Elephantulus edwardii]